ncbi:MAG: hypothetical protein CMP60_00860 [Flavobacteriales bacterium]|nr:hypothetical protein [Flavobacteriales bacterium]|tara:strand:+ start:358 stop:663 length:306 start_codon:yes stop_codon:yes gene_type:complete
MNDLVNGNTLVFKVSEQGEIGELNFTGDVTNFIADMSDVTSEVIEIIKNNLITFGQSIDPKKGSFVVVSTHQFDENLNIVPTMQEAFDYIEMEDIERQLDF